MRLTPSLHRLGEAIVCCYLLEEAGEVTVIDAGVPAYFAELTAELAAMGRTIEDVRAIVLTHGHEDHIGFAERLRVERGVPVSVHEFDRGPGARRGREPERWHGRAQAPLPAALRAVAHATRRDADQGADGGRHLRPGHDAWTCRARCASSIHPDTPPAAWRFHAPGHDALFVGDALATDAVIAVRRGPQVCPFAADPDERWPPWRASKRSRPTGCCLVTEGPWTDGVAAAVTAAREVGIDHLARAKR